jgi:hypothetical protein
MFVERTVDFLPLGILKSFANSKPIIFCQQFMGSLDIGILRPALTVALMSNFRRVKCNSNNR